MLQQHHSCYIHVHNEHLPDRLRTQSIRSHFWMSEEQDLLEIIAEVPKKDKKRVHVLAIGDVGSTLLTGLHLLGGDCISSIGICDISDKVTARWEFEENQIAYPWAYDALPEIDIVQPEDLFKCDVFVFVASKGIPPVGSQVKDVRMYQFENNSKIVAIYAKQARRYRACEDSELCGNAFS